MKLIRATPKVGPHPELLTYRCARCGEVQTIERPDDSAKTPRP